VRRHGVDPSLGSRRLADAWLTTARAYRRRVDGDDDPATWRAVGDAWAALKIPYETARARWREAEARLGSGAGRAGRAAARKPLLEAVRLAVGLRALPLVRELRELAGRALISLPPEVDALVGAEPENGTPPLSGSVVAALGAAATNGAEPSALVLGVAGSRESPAKSDTFGLSGREREVLMQVARGRTNREIGERLFISEKTVGVHVGKILSKLRVSGRVEAATVAIRLGLTERN
jgi:DNA-binding CsgD family transcriptional regulator